MFGQKKFHEYAVLTLQDSDDEVDVLEGGSSAASAAAGMAGAIQRVSCEPTEQEIAEMRVRNGKALRKAASDRNVEDIRLVASLLERGAKLDSKDRRTGFTALHHACVNGHAQMARALIEAKAPMEARENDKWTPLMVATTNGHTKIMVMLLEYGADPNLKDAEGRTALDIASGMYLAFDEQPEAKDLLNTWTPGMNAALRELAANRV